jgi:hypothetical protein
LAQPVQAQERKPIRLITENRGQVLHWHMLILRVSPLRRPYCHHGLWLFF